MGESDTMRNGQYGTVFCPGCGAPVMSGAAFCPNCGTRIQVNQVLRCSACGAQLPAGAGFCSNCGQPVQNAYGANAQGAARQNGQTGYGENPGYAQGGQQSSYGVDRGYASNRPMGGYGVGSAEVELIKNPIFLAFAAVFSLHLALNIILNFNLTTLAFNAPLIVICVGIWMLFASVMQGNLKTTGMHLVSGAVLAEMILSIIEGAIFVLVGIFLMAVAGRAEELILIGFLVILIAAAFIVVMILYWRSLHTTAKQFTNRLEGKGGPLTGGMLPIVLIILSAAVSLIGIIVSSAIRRVIVSALKAAIGSSYNMLSGYLNLDALFATGVLRGVLLPILAAAVSILAVLVLLMIRGIGDEG